MRCFVAVKLPADLKEVIAEEVRNLCDIGIKKVAPDNLHLTLKFLGELNEKKIEDVKKKLKEVELERFLVKLKGIGCFPNKDFIRIVWIGVSEGKENLIQLQEKINEKLFDVGFGKEKKFEPHLTIARVGFLQDKKRFIEKLRKIKPKWKFEVSSFELMESILQKNGPEYKEIKSFKLI